MKFQHPIVFLLLCLCLGWTSSCNKKATDSQKVVKLARVDGDYLTLKEARSQVPAFLMAKDSVKALQSYREKWVRQQLLVKEAHQLQLMKQKLVQERLSRARTQILMEALKDAIIARFNETAQVTAKEVKNYYKKHKAQIKLKQRYVRFRHIATKSITSARSAQEELQEGGAWPEVAMLYSIQPNQKVEQAQKYLPQAVVLNEMPIMQQLLPELEPGEVSPIQRVQGIYHVVQLMDVQDKGANAKPAWLMEQLKKWLLAEKHRKYYNSYVKNLYFNAKSDNELEIFDVLTSPIDTKSDTANTNKSND